MAIFGLAYWHWLFAPIEGAFVNAFQTAPVDLGWRISSLPALMFAKTR